MLLVPNYLSMGKMLDYPVTGGVLNGYSTRKDIHLNDNVSILALWTQKSEIKTPGRVSKEFAVALGSAKLNKSDTRETLDDCHTERTAKIKIENEDDLAFYRFKYYRGNDGKFTNFIDRDSHHLIGKTVEIRSIIMCDGDGIICKKCYGANWRFAVDTSLYKGNINDFTLVLVAQILQGVISIKHYLGGILMKMIVTWLEKEMEMQEFIKLDIVNDIDYNIVEFNSTCKCELRKEHIGDEFETLFIDGNKLTYDNEITRVGGNRFKFTVPNDSVMRKAENLLTALNNHRKEDYFTKKSDFDISDFLHLSIEDQLMEILSYLRSRIKLNHFIHYELMVYGMTRDMDNKSQRVTKDTKRILFMHSNDILLYPDRNHSMASTLPYGYISKALSTVYKDNKPDEYDLLYVNLLNKEPNNDTAYREMNSVLADAIKRNDDYFGYSEGLTNNVEEGE